MRFGLSTLLLSSLVMVSGCFGRGELRFTYHLDVTPGVPSALADGTPIPLTIQAVNYDGAHMANMAVNLEVTTGTAVLVQPAMTDANGQTSGSVASTTPGIVTVTVIGSPNTMWDGQVEEARVSFTARVPSGSPSVRLTASPTLLQAGSTSTLTVLALDGLGKPLPNAAIVLVPSDGQASISPTQGVTDAHGTFAAQMIDNHATTVTVTASMTPSGGLPTSAQTSVTFSPAAIALGHTSLVISPSTVAADGTTPASVVFTAADAFGNPVRAAGVSFTVDGSATTLNPNARATDANGVATILVTSALAQSENVIATSGGVSVHAAVTFSAGSPSALHSTLVASPNTNVTADGATLTHITVVVADTQGNALPNVPVSVTASGAGNTGLPANGNTDGTGTYTASLASTKAGSHTITATAGGVTLNTNVMFSAGAASSARSVLTASPNSLAADGVHPSLLTLTLLDAQGNGIAGAGVTFTNSDSLSVVTGSPTVTDANGVATATVKSVHAMVTTQTAKGGGLTLTTPVTFNPGSPASVTLTATPSSIVANGTAFAAVTFTVSDAQGNANPNQTVSITGGNAGSIGTPAAGTTDGNGQYSIHWSSTLAGTSTLTGTCGALTQNVTVTTTPGPPSGFSVTGLSTVIQGQPTSAVVTAVDANQNVTPAYLGTVTFTSTDSTATLPVNYTFVASDNGVHSITNAITFLHSGAQTFTVADTGNAAINGNGTVSVTPLLSSTLVLESRNSPTTCLTLPALNNVAGATLSTSACAFHSDQVFAFGNDNAMHVASLCVEVAGAAYANGATVQLNTCNGAPEQGWALVGNTVQSTGNTSYCLDEVSSGSTVVINACASVASQSWNYHGVSPTYAVLNASIDRALDVHGANFLNNAALDTYTYNGTTSQQFNLNVDGTLSDTPGNGSPWCVEVQNGIYSAGVHPVINPCTGTAQQAWVQVGRTLRPRAAQTLCLDLNTGAAVGQSVLLSTCSGAASQQLTLQTVASNYKFVEKANTSLCISNTASDTANGAVTINTCANTFQQLFHEAALDNNSVSYKFPGGGTMIDGGATLAAGNPTTQQNMNTDPCSVQWAQLPVGDGFAYVGEYDASLGLDANATTAGQPLIVNTYAATDTQVFYKWTMAMNIALVAAPTQCLGVSDTHPAVGSAVVVQPCSAAPNQQWIWNSSNGSFQNAGLCMDVVGATFAPGAVISLNNCNASSQQKWNNSSNFGGSLKWFNGSVTSYCLDTSGQTATGSPLFVVSCSSLSSNNFIPH